MDEKQNLVRAVMKAWQRDVAEGLATSVGGVDEDVVAVAAVAAAAELGKVS